MSRHNEKVRFARLCLQPSMPLNHIFQCPRGRRSCRDDPPARFPGGIETGCRRFRHFEALGLERMFRGIFRAHRNECTDAHMQGNLQDLHASRLERVERRFGEVQACCWRRHGPGHTRIDGLIIGGVGRRVLPIDIWRERNMSVTFQQVFHRFR